MRAISVCQVSSAESRKDANAAVVERDAAAMPTATSAVPLDKSGSYLEYAWPVLEEHEEEAFGPRSSLRSMVLRAHRDSVSTFIRCSYASYEHHFQELFIRMNTSQKHCSYSGWL